MKWKYIFYRNKLLEQNNWESLTGGLFVVVIIFVSNSTPALEMKTHRLAKDAVRAE